MAESPSLAQQAEAVARLIGREYVTHNINQGPCLYEFDKVETAILAALQRVQAETWEQAAQEVLKHSTPFDSWLVGPATVAFELRARASQETPTNG